MSSGQQTAQHRFHTLFPKLLSDRAKILSQILPISALMHPSPRVGKKAVGISAFLYTSKKRELWPRVFPERKGEEWGIWEGKK